MLELADITTRIERAAAKRTRALRAFNEAQGDRTLERRLLADAHDDLLKAIADRP